jgi:hypothetical protein
MGLLAIEKEPGSEEKTVLVDLQGTRQNLRDEVVEAAGFPSREGVLFHSNEAIAYSGPGWKHTWYQALFWTSVQAGMLEAANLAGFRNRPVFIAGSRHVPPPQEFLMDGMDTLFRLLKLEGEPAVRAVPGHFLFVFSHPCPDGNGRLGRFLMNVMLASGGYPWTVVRLKRRRQYRDALEQASVGGNIRPFSEYVLQEPGVDRDREEKYQVSGKIH